MGVTCRGREGSDWLPRTSTILAVGRILVPLAQLVPEVSASLVVIQPRFPNPPSFELFIAIATTATTTTTCTENEFQTIVTLSRNKQIILRQSPFTVFKESQIEIVQILVDEFQLFPIFHLFSLNIYNKSRFGDQESQEQRKKRAKEHGGAWTKAWGFFNTTAVGMCWKAIMVNFQQ